MKSTKRVKIGIYTTSVAIIALAIAALVNLLFGYIPTTYTKLDTTALGLYEISDETREIVASIDEDITLYLISAEGEESVIVNQMLDRYAAMNPHISCKKIDPVLHPTFESPAGTQYTLGDYKKNTVIVCGQSKDKVVDYTEIFQTEYSQEEQYNYYYYGTSPTGTTSFYGEAKLTGALEYVSSKELPVVYTLTGHGETAFGDTLAGYLSDDNYETEQLTLLTAGSVPEDASCVVINNPTSDLSSEETAALTAYIDAGGKVLLVTGYNGTDITALANICSFGSSYGINAMEGIAIEGSASNYMSGYPYYLIPNLGSHAITTAVGTGVYTFMPLAHGLQIAEDAPEGITPSALLTTTSSAYTTNGKSVSAADAVYTGQMYLGVIAEKKADDGTAGGSLTWYSSMGITDDSADSSVSGGNSKLFLATLSYLCDKEASVSIAAKSMAVESLVVPEGAANAWSTVLTILLPLAIIVPGFCYWMYRRKR